MASRSSMKIGIYSRELDNNKAPDVKLLLDELRRHNIEPVIFQDLFNTFYSSIEIEGPYSTFNATQDLSGDLDCMISLGGDGTLLDTVALVKDSDIPVLGVNYGRLGFLANVGRDELGAAIEDIVKRNYVLDKRTLIHVTSDTHLFGKTPYGLNEFVVHKKDTSPMIKIHTFLNGEFLNTYWADGLIVSTPTGSTGYNLSCGGPVVFPESGCFSITAVAPHNLNVRPIVIPDSSVLSFELEGRADGFLVSLDSRREVVPKEIQLAVRKENFGLNLIRFHDSNFLQTLRNKLSWGLDKRNW